MAYKTNLSNNDATFASMMENGFGIVTVMNAKIYEAEPEVYVNKTAYDILTYLNGKEALCALDTLKIANVTQEGPVKTITGGKYSNALVKFGKSARLEMQDALGNAKAIEYLCGGIREWTGGLNNYVEGLSGLHFGEDFQGPKAIVGESFFIDRATGRQVDVNIVFYQFLPDSIFNLTQDAEGDATVFDMNGDLLTTEILLGTDDEDGNEKVPHGVFYSILPATPVNEEDEEDDNNGNNGDNGNQEDQEPTEPEDQEPTPDPETPSVVETTISPDWGNHEGWKIEVDIEDAKTFTVTAPNAEFELSYGTVPTQEGDKYVSTRSIEEGDEIGLSGQDLGNGYTIIIGNKNKTWPLE